MDLAKIRKKSFEAPKDPGDVYSSLTVSSPEPAKSTFESVPVVSPAPAEVDFFQKESFFAAIDSSAVAVPPIIAEHVAVTCTPLEAILAGRAAAGCDDESIIADEVTGEVAIESRLEFLCFRVSNEVYGINIMDIKEIIKTREVTEVPRAPSFVSGVLSLRGTIIPIIDMRVRLGLTCEEPTGKERIIVIKNNNTFSGLLVDEVIKVVQVQPDDVEATPAVLDGIDRDFVAGLGRSDGRLIIIQTWKRVLT